MIYAVPYQHEYSDSEPMTGSGYASTLPIEPIDDVVERLRQVVEEVTRRPVQREPARKIGFV